MKQSGQREAEILKYFPHMYAGDYVKEQGKRAYYIILKGKPNLISLSDEAPT